MKKVLEVIERVLKQHKPLAREVRRFTSYIDARSISGQELVSDWDANLPDVRVRPRTQKVNEHATSTSANAQLSYDVEISSGAVTHDKIGRIQAAIYDAFEILRPLLAAVPEIKRADVTDATQMVTSSGEAQGTAMWIAVMSITVDIWCPRGRLRSLLA